MNLTLVCLNVFLLAVVIALLVQNFVDNPSFTCDCTSKGKIFINKPLVLSLSTSPKRLKHTQDRLNDILKNQTLKPELIYLNLPMRFARTNETYDENEILKLKYAFGDSLVVLRPDEDFGPITKLLPAVLEEKEKGRHSLIITIDDDIQYPKNLFEELVKHYKHKKDVISNSTPTMTEEDLQIVEGFSGVLYDVDAFDEDFVDFVSKANQYKKCFTGDDYVISRYLRSKGIKVKPLHKSKYHIQVLPLDFGLGEDALHVIDDSSNPEVRYKFCKNFFILV